MNKIFLIGDSTCQTNKKRTYPQTGWGQVFFNYIDKKYKVINLAKNGRSTKSFIDEGRFKVCERKMSKGDYLFIQFGHNDEKDDILRHTDPFGSYQDNLLFFINKAKEKGVTPILLSSIYRRRFDEKGNIIDNCHLDYPDACKDLANRFNVIYIDMCSITKDWLSSIGDEPSKQYFMNFKANIYKNYPEGKEDNTHLTLLGAHKICELLVNELNKLNIII